MKRTSYILSPLMLAAVATLAACGGGGETAQQQPPATYQPPPYTKPNTDLVTSVPDPVYETTGYGPEKLAAFNMLNNDRARCGFGKLTQNTTLDQAAQAHADYLKANTREWTHTEIAGHTGFTGAYPYDRGVAAGYNAANYSEMFAASFFGSWFSSQNGPSKNYSDLEQPATITLHGLYASVYHLQGLMNSNRDVGLGVVFESHPAGVGQTASQKILVLNSAIRSGAVEQLVEQDALATFPCDGSAGMDPYFRPELPNPFPGVNLHDNPYGQPVYLMAAKGETLALTSSSITLIGGGSVATRQLTAANDPQKLLKANEVFLVPTAALAENAEYEVVLSGTNTGMITAANPSGSFTRTFKFKTGTEYIH